VKYIVLSLFLSTLVGANEMQRLESIVKDIETLRADYNLCVRDLDIKNRSKVVLKNDVDAQTNRDLKELKIKMQEYKVLLDDERTKNTLLITKVDTLNKAIKNQSPQLTSSDKSNKKYLEDLKAKEKENKIKYEENINDLEKKYKNILKTKDKLILSLKNKDGKVKVIKLSQKEVCKDNNPFPSLMMKEPALKKELNKTKIDKVTLDLEKNIITKAATFRLNKESEIYDDINGNILFLWEDKTSFTSLQMTENWIKISGYFVDKKWQKSKKDLWVKKLNTIKR